MIDQVVRAADEVVDRALFRCNVRAEVPIVAEFTAAARVTFGEHAAAFEPSEARRRKRRADHDAVGAVPVEERRMAAVEGEFAPAHDRERDLRSVGAGGVDLFRCNGGEIDRRRLSQAGVRYGCIRRDRVPLR